MTTFLADGNLLIALTTTDHVHHRGATEWFESEPRELATCAITEGTLMRFLLREGIPVDVAVAMLDEIGKQSWHRFLSADIPFDEGMLRGVIGHRQVTDAYLVALAARHGATLVTLDRGLAALHGDEIELVGA